MKFLLVSPFTNASGSAIRFWNIAAALREKGHRVVYADRLARRSVPLHAVHGVAYYGCPSCGILFIDVTLSFFFYLAVFLRHLDCEVFFALKPAPNNCFVALGARLLGKKIILDVDDLDYAYLKKGAARNIMRFFFDRLPRFFDMVTYHTPALRDYLVQDAGVTEKKLHYLAQGVTPVFFDRALLSAPLPFTPASIIYLATLGITSDFDDMVPALKSLFERTGGITMNVVGDGNRRKEFEGMIRDAGIADRVRFLGTIDHAALPAFISSHRIGINYMRPSPVNRCRAILKIREYLACGLEVVCNDVGDVVLFKDHIHIAPNIDAMFEIIGRLLSRPKSYNSAGRAFVMENYLWSGIIDKFFMKVTNL